jgi:outer membrane biosynthesis protein TonB
MRKKSRFGILLAIFLFGAAASTMAQAIYTAAEVAAADNFKPPWNSDASGIVVLNVKLDATGALVGVDVLRDLPPLTNSAKSAVQSWQFKPALVGSGPRPSDLLAVFVVPPPVSFPTYPHFPSLPPKAGSISGYVLPGIVSASYAQYPVDSVVSGSVVIQVTVGADGNATAWQTVRALDPCTRFALEATKKWRFRAAALDGHPVSSKIAIDFVFQPPLTTQ